MKAESSDLKKSPDPRERFRGAACGRRTSSRHLSCSRTVMPRAASRPCSPSRAAPAPPSAITSRHHGGPQHQQHSALHTTSRPLPHCSLSEVAFSRSSDIGLEPACVDFQARGGTMRACVAPPASDTSRHVRGHVGWLAAGPRTQSSSKCRKNLGGGGSGGVGGGGCRADVF